MSQDSSLLVVEVQDLFVIRQMEMFLQDDLHHSRWILCQVLISDLSCHSQEEYNTHQNGHKVLPDVQDAARGQVGSEVVHVLQVEPVDKENVLEIQTPAQPLIVKLVLEDTHQAIHGVAMNVQDGCFGVYQMNKTCPHQRDRQTQVSIANNSNNSNNSMD